MTKVYFPQDKEIRVHLSRVKLCPPNFPAGFYWYGGKKRGPGHSPKWVEQMMALDIQSEVQTGDESRIKDGSHATDHQDRSDSKRSKSSRQSRKAPEVTKTDSTGQPEPKKTRTRHVLLPVRYS